MPSNASTSDALKTFVPAPLATKLLCNAVELLALHDVIE